MQKSNQGPDGEIRNVLDRIHTRSLDRGRKVATPVPIYALTAHDAMKLKKSTSGDDAGVSVAGGSFVFKHLTMAEFAERLRDFSAMDRPVLDKTGIEGAYDITLESAARNMPEDPAFHFSVPGKSGIQARITQGSGGDFGCGTAVGELDTRAVNTYFQHLQKFCKSLYTPKAFSIILH